MPAAKTSSTIDSQDAAARVLRRFRVVFNAVKAHFRDAEKMTGVPGAQLWALSVIRERPGLGMNELARAMDVHQSTASNLVRSLVEQGLVAAAKGSTDRRAVHLKILAAGTRILRRAPGPYPSVLPAALASLDAQTLTRLDKDLGRLAAALGADPKGAKVMIGPSSGPSS
ncbi:MAG: MarR family winged helix-turn-helix transcriptional regulator [Pseudomonadota bacterium]